MIGSNSFARLSGRGTVKLGVWLFACLHGLRGHRSKRRMVNDRRRTRPVPTWRMPANRAQMRRRPEQSGGQQPDADNPPPSSLKLPNLLHDVTPGEGAAPPTTSTSGATAPAEGQPSAPSGQTQAAPSNEPPPAIPPKGEGPSVAAYTMRTRINFVQVPVTVKDSHGALLPGLTYNDFQVYEDGVRQRITLFTEDAFPLSVAFVIDQNLPSDTMRKVNEALSAFQGAFAPYDEVSVYTYATHVSQATGFTGAQSDRLVATLERVKSPGRYMEVPSNTGPMAEGPSINGHMVDPKCDSDARWHLYRPHPQRKLCTERRHSARRDRSFATWPGTPKNHLRHQRWQEPGEHSFDKEVVRYLLTNQIAVDGTLVGDSALPVYGFLDRFHIPWQMADNLLPRYAGATGGILDAELSRNAIEASFARIAGQVRNQYTLGYYSHISVLDSRFRRIEVRVLLPNVNVVAKQGYYPTATASQ